jgi:hypothetical protein
VETTYGGLTNLLAPWKVSCLLNDVLNEMLNFTCGSPNSSFTCFFFVFYKRKQIGYTLKKMFKRLGTWSTIFFTDDQPIFSWNKIINQGNGCISFHFQATCETLVALKLDCWVTKFQSSKKIILAFKIDFRVKLENKKSKISSMVLV